YWNSVYRYLYSFLHDALPISPEIRRRPGFVGVWNTRGCAYWKQLVGATWIAATGIRVICRQAGAGEQRASPDRCVRADQDGKERSEEHTSELQSRVDLVCRLL